MKLSLTKRKGSRSEARKSNNPKKVQRSTTEKKTARKFKSQKLMHENL